MERTTGWKGWAAGLVLVALPAMATAAAPAAWSTTTTPGTSCAACHGTPPDLPSDSATYGKIVQNAAALLSESALRSAITANVSMGAGIAGAYSVADLNAVRAYLVRVRDATVTSSMPAFPLTAVGAVAPGLQDIVIINERGKALGYTCSLSGTNLGDFQIVGGCSGTVLAQDSRTLSIRYAPTVAGTRTATFNLGLSGDAADPVPPARMVTLQGTAIVLAPQLSLPASLSTTAVVGTPLTTSTSLTNTGNANLTLSFGAPTGAQAAEFSVDAASTCSGGPVLPSTSCTLLVRFAPAAAGSRNATLPVTHNASGSPGSIALVGTATPAPAPAIQLNATALTFASQTLGTASAAQSLQLTNNGTAPLTLSALSVSGAALGDFSLGGTCVVGTPLAVGTQCNVSVTFQPAALGARSAALAINSNASNGNAVVTLGGTGVPVPAPAVSFSSALVDFGPQSVGGLYVPRSVRLRNSGTAAMVIAGLTVSGAGFSRAATTCGAALAAGADCTVDVAFAPTAVGATSTGALTLNSDVAGSPHTVSLTGRGVAATLPVLVWSPVATTLAFGDVSAGTVSPVQSATVRNQGPGGVTLQILNAIGAQPAAFSVGGTCTPGLVLLEGATCQVDVRFLPTLAGLQSAEVQLASTGTLPPHLVLTGTGLAGPAPAATLSTTALAFADTAVGAQSAPQEVLLSSSGSGALQVTAVALDGPFVRVGGSCPVAPQSFALVPGQSCTLRLALAPGHATAVAGTLSIAVSGLAQPLQVTLSGRGTDPPPDSGGGCSIASGVRSEGGVDPLLALLSVGALGVLVARRRRRGGRDARR
jgi:trimeric autotransporter adhesin